MYKISLSFMRIIVPVLLMLLTISCAGPGPYPDVPDITVHSPNEKTFYIPNTDEPLPILISFPEGMDPGSFIFDIELIDDEGRVIFRRGGPPSRGPLVTIGTQPGQRQSLNPPEMTTPGWYTVKVYGDTFWGESEPFRLSHLGPAMDDHALTVNFPAETTFHPGGTIHLTWHDWGDDCDSSRGFTVMLFRNGTHGISHSQWLLEMNATGTEGDFLIPGDIPTDGLYFIWVDNGPRCEGTTNPIPVGP